MTEFEKLADYLASNDTGSAEWNWSLSFWDRVKLLFGAPIHIKFVFGTDVFSLAVTAGQAGFFLRRHFFIK